MNKGELGLAAGTYNSSPWGGQHVGEELGRFRCEFQIVANQWQQAWAAAVFLLWEQENEDIITLAKFSDSILVSIFFPTNQHSYTWNADC